MFGVVKFKLLAYLVSSMRFFLNQLAAFLKRNPRSEKVRVLSNEPTTAKYHQSKSFSLY